MNEHSAPGPVLAWCVLRGRLGNNLFQYAAARALCPRAGVVLDYSRTGVALTMAKISGGAFARLRLPGLILPPLLNRLVHRIIGKALFEAGWIRRTGDADWPPRPARAMVLLDGYFQDAGIVSLAGRDFRGLVLNRLARAAGRPAEPRDAVAVHIRRGDFLDDPGRAVCDEAWFRRAIGVVRKLAPGLETVIFSDDPAWCRERFAGDGVRFAEGAEAGDPVAALFAMSMCRHQILSNSTFSWWAGWLNPSPEKIVIGPERWSTDNLIDPARLRFPGYRTLAEAARERL